MSTIRKTQVYKFPVDKVWSAITEPEQMKKWYFYVHDFKLEEGNVFTFYENESGGNFLHRCEILKVIPNELFEHTWEHPNHSKGKSVLTWKLESLSDASTQLTLTHSGLENFSDAGPEFAPENYDGGWDGFVKTALKNYLNGIEKLVFEVDIQAPPEKVWGKLWNAESYKIWTSAFSDGSSMVGELKEGNRIHFVNENGEGIYSDIVYLKENKWIIFSHIGNIQNGKELPLDEETEKWTGSFESYKLSKNDNSTRLIAEIDNERTSHEVMTEKFSKAFKTLKEICEH
jgi:uncharacterized protein YndB with AHSA1/START domain